MLGKLQQLLDQNLIFACAKQFCFSRYIGNRPFVVNQQERSITFGDDIIFKANILGSESFSEDTWTWAWAMADYKEEAIAKAAQKLRKLGLKQEITLLTRKTCPIDATINGFTLAAVCTDIAKVDGFYSYESGSDERTYVLISKVGKDTFDAQPTAKDVRKAFESLMPHVSFDHFTSLKHACIEANVGEIVSPQKIIVDTATIIFDEVGNCLDIQKRDISTAGLEKKTSGRHRRSGRSRSRR